MNWRHFLALSATLTASLCVPSAGSEAKSWLCIADNAGGIRKIENEWKGTEITSGDKYLIKPIDRESPESQLNLYENFPFMSQKIQYTHGFYYFGAPIDKFPELLCYEKIGSIICRSEDLHEFIQQFVINMDSRRFEFIFPGNYLSENEKYMLTPEIEIGSCSEI